MLEILKTILSYAGMGLFVLVVLGSIPMTILGLPGSVVIVVAGFVYSAATGWSLPWWVLGVLAGLAVLTETLDNVITAVGVKRYGGSKGGMLWALVGGIAGGSLAGAILGPPLGPLGWVLMPLLGGMAGGYLGGYVYERRQGRPPAEARRAGFGAMVGRVAGGAFKILVVMVMAGLLLAYAF